MVIQSSEPTVKKCTPDCPEIEKGCHAYHLGWDCTFDDNYKWYSEMDMSDVVIDEHLRGSPTTAKETEK